MATYIVSAATCSDGVKNQDETDIDCGSFLCPKCADTKECRYAFDCISGVCTGNICQGRHISVGNAKIYILYFSYELFGWCKE